MSIAIAHFAVGAALTTLVVAALAPDCRYPRTAVLLGGGWAMLPDVHWVSPVAEELLYRFHGTPIVTDLFWFHGTLDRVDPGDSKAVAAVAIAAFLVVTASTEWLEHRRAASSASTRGVAPDGDRTEHPSSD